MVFEVGFGRQIIYHEVLHAHLEMKERAVQVPIMSRIGGSLRVLQRHTARAMISIQEEGIENQLWL